MICALDQQETELALLQRSVLQKAVPLRDLVPAGSAFVASVSKLY